LLYTIKARMWLKLKADSW